ncbi:MAG: NAD(P)/FAD-dependent oxidoreductase [Ferruginibacter sp.]
MHFDVIIIGSGPAGCAAAISCKQQGLHTLLITGKKDDTQNDKVQPSESIHPGLIPVLTQLNAVHCIETASQGLYKGIYVNDQLNPLGQDEHGAWQGHHINRKIFDAAFLQTAIDQNITISDNENVNDIITTGDRITGIITIAAKFTCQYLIDASGHKHIAGKKLKFKEVFFSPPLVVWTGVSKNIPADLFPFEKDFTKFIPHVSGWTWLAPELEDRCTWTRLEVKGKQEFLPPAELKNSPLAAKIKVSNRRWRAFRPVCKEGVLLCGDAAGIIDPAAGQGILNAILSATMAAKTVKACISNPAFEAIYLAGYDDWFISNYEDKVNRLKHFYKLNGITIFDSE